MSEELASQAEEMQGTISFFHVRGGTQESPSTVKQADPKNAPRRTVAKPTLTANAPSPRKAPPVDAKPASRARLSGIQITLDDDAPAAKRDAVDDDYEQF